MTAMTGAREGSRGEARTGWRRGYIPRPPSKEDLDRLSEAQALITDEWTGEPPARAVPTDAAPARR
jgi:hypothetical protein